MGVPLQFGGTVLGHPLAAPVQVKQVHPCVSGRIPFLPSKAVFPVVEVTAHLVLENLVAPQAHQSPIRIKVHRQARCRVGRFAPGGMRRPRKPSVPRRVQSS